MRAQLKTLAVVVALGFTASTVAVTAADAHQSRHRVLVCKSTKSARNKGTVVGGLTGGTLGAVVAGHGNKTEGAVLGGVVGAVAGNQIAKHNSKKKNCHYEYRYY
ncbi:glycine zipper domain-containing protein [Caulobacter sp. LARHSG274]